MYIISYVVKWNPVFSITLKIYFLSIVPFKLKNKVSKLNGVVLSRRSRGL